MSPILVDHPVRRGILDLLASAEEPLSPVALSGLLAERLGTVAYHARVLRDAGALELVEERRKRGAVEHFYALTGHGAGVHAGDPLTIAVQALERVAEQGRELEEEHGLEVPFRPIAEAALTRIRAITGARPQEPQHA